MIEKVLLFFGGFMLRKLLVNWVFMSFMLRWGDEFVFDFILKYLEIFCFYFYLFL